MSGAEFQELCDSIRENGQRESIKVLPDGRIVDGRNRYLACQEIGVAPRSVIVKMDDLDVLYFVIDKNVRRRHLTKSQAAVCAVEFLPLEKKCAAQRRAAGQRKGGKTAGRGRKKDSSSQTFDGSNENAGRATERAAKKMGTNRQSVHDAAKIKNEDQKAFQAIKDGRKTVSQVKREKVEEKRVAKRAADAKRIEEAPSLLEVVGKATFSTIVIDPPWDYGDEGDKDQFGRGLPTYGTLSIDELRLMTKAVGQIPHPDTRRD